MIDIEQFLMSFRRHKDADGKLKPIYLADTLQEEITIIQEAVKHSRRLVEEQRPVEVSPLEFVTAVLEKEHLIGKPIMWAQWPNEEKNT